MEFCVPRVGRLLAFGVCIASAGTLAACGGAGGGGSYTAPTASPSSKAATPTASPIVTTAPVTSPSAAPAYSAPPLPAETPFTVATGGTLAVPSPSAGTTAAPIPIALPSSAGFGGSVSLPVQGAVIPPNTSYDLTASSVEPATVPALAFLTHPLSVVRPKGTAVATILFETFLFNTDVKLPSGPLFTFNLPAAYASPSYSYYVAEYVQPYAFLGWQLGFEGPGTVSGSTVSFTPGGSTYQFFADIPTYFALYAVAPSAPTPPPVSTASPAPTPVPLSASPGSISLLAAGAMATISVTDPSSYSGSYTATIGNTAVATASVAGKTVTVTAVAAGTTTLIISTSDGRQLLIPVTVTTTSVPIS